VVTLVLLTGAICLGVAAKVGWRSRSLPRFVVAGLHRNLTLLALAFLALHVATTVADSFAPIGLKDAFVPFLASYRSIWLGLGALACDLLLALVATSLIRVRVGYRAWRLTHWFAYAAWPLALVHALGTGSDARFGWMAAIAAVCLCAVALALVVRALDSGMRPRALTGLAAAAASALALGVWYSTGPAQPGWAARAGTPAKLLTYATPRAAAQLPSRVPVRTPRLLPGSFVSRIAGSLSESLPDQSGLVTLRIRAQLNGSVDGELRLTMRGSPDDGGGISVTSSGVDFQGPAATPLYQGSVTGLDGATVIAELRDASGQRLRLLISLRINDGTGAISGSVRGAKS
jgi:hypothetical protein